MNISMHDRMKPGDTHFVADLDAGKVRGYDYGGHPTGQEWDVRGRGVNGPGWDRVGGDTVPGHYELGAPIWTQPDEPEHIHRPYGPVFLPLLDIDGVESAQGRAGEGVHGGGSSLEAPEAPRQPLTDTEGCDRMHNRDAVELAHYVEGRHASGHRCFWTAVWAAAQ